jgi:hypothetical protein
VTGRLQRALLGLVAAGLLASGCGDDSGDGRVLSRKQASDLRGTLSQVEQSLAAKNCTGAEQQVAAFREEVDSIHRLDRDLRSALRASTRRLETLVSGDCETETTTPPETETTPTTPEEGTTGTTGATGEEGQNGKKPKKPKKEKPTSPEEQEEPPSDDETSGGGAAPPDELDPDGDSIP